MQHLHFTAAPPSSLYLHTSTTTWEDILQPGCSSDIPLPQMITQPTYIFTLPLGSCSSFMGFWPSYILYICVYSVLKLCPTYHTFYVYLWYYTTSILNNLQHPAQPGCCTLLPASHSAWDEPGLCEQQLCNLWDGRDWDCTPAHLPFHGRRPAHYRLGSWLPRTAPPYAHLTVCPCTTDHQPPEHSTPTAATDHNTGSYMALSLHGGASWVGDNPFLNFSIIWGPQKKNRSRWKALS